MTVFIDYQKYNKRINISIVDEQFSFKLDKLDDESLLELVQGLMDVDSKKLERVIKLWQSGGE